MEARGSNGTPAEHDAEREPLIKPVCRWPSASTTSFDSHSFLLSEEGVFSLDQGSLLATSICLCKAAVGAGVLSIASHCADVGFLFMLAALIAGGVLTIISVRMIGEASIATGCWSFEDISDQLFHPSLSLVTGLIQSCNCLGAAAAYLIICGQIFQVLSGAGQEWFKPFVILTGICICLPLALARHVNFLRYVSVLSVSGLIFLVLAVAYVLSQNGPDSTMNNGTFWGGAGDTGVFVHMNCLNLVVFAYNNQFNVPQLTGELRKRSTEQVSMVAYLSTISVSLLYGSVAILGLLAFGVGERQLETLVLDLQPHVKHPVVVAALIMVMFSTLMCFEFHIYPIRQFLAYSVRKCRGRGADEEESDEKLLGISMTRWLDICCATGAVTFAIIVAARLKSVRHILDFVGAFAAAYTSYVVPPMWILKLRSRPKAETDDNALMQSQPVLNWVVFGIGIFFFVFGTYAAIAD